jgi:hypothetical protein
MGIKGNHKIIFFFLLFLSFAAKAQQERLSLPYGYSLKDSVKLLQVGKNSYSKAVLIPPKPIYRSLGGQLITPDYFTRRWGIFCETEWRFEKKTGLPLRFRLGSLEYVDRLEGKRR